MRRTPAVVVFLAILTVPSAGIAQDTTGTARASCEGKRITGITIVPRRPSIIGEEAPWWRRVALAVLLQYKTTTDDVIRSFLQLKQGGICSEFRREESERVLRAQPFLADASVRAYPDSNGVHIVVETVDEIPLVIGGSVSRGSLASATFGNSNVLGRGQYAALRWRKGFAYRDGFGARFVDYNTFAEPLRLTVDAERGRLGGRALAAFQYPFFTNLQRAAWHTGITYVDDFTSFVRPDTDAVSLSMERTFADVGAVGRLNFAGRGLYAGALLTHEHVIPGTSGVVISDSGLVADSAAALRSRYRSLLSTRLAGLLGIRLFSFHSVRGFDALYATQDLPSGVQIGTHVGRGLTRRSDDWLYAADVFTGAKIGNSFLGARGVAEARHDLRAGRWDGIVVSGRAAYYVKPWRAHTLIVSSEFSGAWSDLIPFQLRLGDSQGGVRGYGDSRVAGGRRLVFRSEERWALGTLRDRAAFGVGAFVDVGRMWAGGVPYGVNSPYKTGLGISLLATVPARSQRLWRIDIAAPVSSDPRAKWEVRVGSQNIARVFWREPRDVARARTLSVASDIFGLR
jgi:hypothetical protein